MRITVVSCLLVLMGWSADAQTFSEVSIASGIEIAPAASNYMGGGVAVFDYNNDGWEDVYVTGCLDKDKLYRNNGNFSFTDVTESAGLEVTETKNTTGVVSGDIDRDGDLDIFISTWRSTMSPDFTSNILLLNNGDGTFADISEEAGITHAAFTVSSGFFDANLDGHLDIYVSNYVEHSGFLISNGQIIGFDHDCFDDYLYINNGDNTFTESAEAYGCNNNGCALAVALTDYNRDGLCDIMVANDFGEFIEPDRLYENQYPEGFTDVAPETESDIFIYGMGIAVGDYDEDQDLDYYVTNLGRNVLLKNEDGVVFTDYTTEAGIENTGTEELLYTSWGTFFQDLDNDSWLDLYVSNGHIPTVSFLENHQQDPNKYYHNNQDGTFEDWSESSGLNNNNVGRGCAYGDFDNNGFLDVLQVNVENPFVLPDQHVLLYQNNEVVGNWVGFNLVGTAQQTNVNAIGAMVELFADGRTLIRELTGGGGLHGSQGSMRIHFGLGEINAIDSVVVHWPGAESESFVASINGYQTLVQGTSVGISELPESQFRIIPNPVKYEFNIQGIKHVQEGELIILDAQGGLVYRTSYYPNQIFHLPNHVVSGLYALTIVSDQFSATTKLLVEK